MKAFNISAAIGCIGTFFFLMVMPTQHLGEEVNGHQWPVSFAKHKAILYKEIKEPAILFVGGSNLLFGLNTKTLSEELQQPAFNFGLGASIGLELLLDLSSEVIKPGDTVVLAIENELLSTDVSFLKSRVITSITDKAIHDQLSLKDKMLMYWHAPFTATITSLDDPRSDRFNKIYQISSLNQWGDMQPSVMAANPPATPFPKNTMTGIYPVKQQNIDVLSAFVENAKRIGAKVVAIPAARYVKDASPDMYFNNENVIYDMYKKLNVDYISSIDEHSFSADQMFDSSNHINPNCKDVRTQSIIRALASFHSNNQSLANTK